MDLGIRYSRNGIIDFVSKFVAYENPNNKNESKKYNKKMRQEIIRQRTRSLSLSNSVADTIDSREYAMWDEELDGLREEYKASLEKTKLDLEEEKQQRQKKEAREAQKKMNLIARPAGRALEKAKSRHRARG